MREYASRRIETATIHGETISFIASNDCMAERIRSASNEAHILDKLVELSSEDITLWDVGACFGIHSFVGTTFYNDVVAFEPMPANRGALMDNKGVNGFNDIYVSPSALSDECGETEFAIRQSERAGYERHSFDVGDYDKVRTITVPQTTGDAAASLSFPNVVKIDVEGAEGMVLEGMHETLRDPRCTDVILETHEPNPVQPSYADYGYTEAGLREMLEDAGFSVSTLEKDYHLYATK